MADDFSPWMKMEASPMEDRLKQMQELASGEPQAMSPAMLQQMNMEMARMEQGPGVHQMAEPMEVPAQPVPNEQWSKIPRRGPLFKLAGGGNG